MVKNQRASAGDLRGVGLIPGSERSTRGGNGNPLPWTEEPDGLQSMESQRARHDRNDLSMPDKREG